MKQGLWVLLVAILSITNSQAYTQEVATKAQPQLSGTISTEESQELVDRPAKGAIAERKPEILGERYETNLFTLILKVIFALSIISVLIYLVVRVFFKSQRWMGQAGGIIQVITTHAISPNKYIQLVELGNRLLVLGISDHNINLLTQITEKETIDLIKTQSSKEVGLKGFTFSQLLKKRWNPEPELDELPNESYRERADFLKEQRRRLKDLELGR